jgi:hypothetical protein
MWAILASSGLRTGSLQPGAKRPKASGWACSKGSSIRTRADDARWCSPEWRCLEIGAGRGSMAVWLAQQVG